MLDKIPAKVDVHVAQQGVLNTHNSTCKRDLDSRPQQRLGVLLSTSRQARAACGVVGTGIAPISANNRGGEFPTRRSGLYPSVYPNEPLRVGCVVKRAGIDGEAHCASVACRSRKTTQRIRDITGTTLRKDAPLKRSPLTSGDGENLEGSHDRHGRKPEANRRRVYRMTATRQQRQPVCSVWKPNGFLSQTIGPTEPHHFLNKGVVCIPAVVLETHWADLQG